MFLVGLTGGISSGKSTVSQILRDQGCVIIDADLIAREVVEKGTRGWQRIRDAFGDQICLDDGAIDRTRLSQIVFADTEKRKLLNSIVHPLVGRRMLWEIMKQLLKGQRYVILDVPLLLESKTMLPFLSEIVVVHCDHGTQLKRLMARNNLTEQAALQMMSSQLPLDSKKRMATNAACLIDNNGTVERLNTQAVELKHYLDSSWRPELLRALVAAVFVAFGYFSI